MYNTVGYYAMGISVLLCSKSTSHPFLHTYVYSPSSRAAEPREQKQSLPVNHVSHMP